MDAFIEFLRDVYKRREIKRLSKVIRNANPDFLYEALNRTGSVVLHTIVDKTLDYSEDFLTNAIGEHLKAQAETIERFKEKGVYCIKLKFSKELVEDKVCRKIEAQVVSENAEMKIVDVY
jgi:hypothetical protein